MHNLSKLLLDKIQLHGAYVRLFNTVDGKIVLAHLIKEGYVLKSTFVAGDPQATALNEGSRRLVLSVLTFVNKSHATLINQLEERLQDDT